MLLYEAMPIQSRPSLIFSGENHSICSQTLQPPVYLGSITRYELFGIETVMARFRSCQIVNDQFPFGNVPVREVVFEPTFIWFKARGPCQLDGSRVCELQSPFSMLLVTLSWFQFSFGGSGETRTLIDRLKRASCCFNTTNPYLFSVGPASNDLATSWLKATCSAN